MDQLTNVSCGLYNMAKNTAWSVGTILKSTTHQLTRASSSTAKEGTAVVTEIVYTLPPNMRRWIAIGGVVGACAVGLGAFGAHNLYPKSDVSEHRKACFEVANKYHFIHSLVLFAVPFARRPMVPGVLFLTGIFIFSGTCYCYALTENSQVRQYTPYGGMALILAWLSMAL